jgi:transcriptional regulator with XRE-family HTH domain
MTRRTPPLIPRLRRTLSALGDNLRSARLRRGYSAELVAQRASITRKTLARVEHGDAAVSLGVYARVLQALGLDGDLATLATDDALGRLLQDAKLSPRRESKRSDSDSGVP